MLGWFPVLGIVLELIKQQERLSFFNASKRCHFTFHPRQNTVQSLFQDRSNLLLMMDALNIGSISEHGRWFVKNHQKHIIDSKSKLG